MAERVGGEQSKMKTSIVITSYNRPRQLCFSLASIAGQDLSNLDYEVIVINDGLNDDTIAVATESEFAKVLNVRYFYTGFRNDSVWRPMGLAANIGIQLAEGEIIVLSNSDIYHIGETIVSVVNGCTEDKFALSTVNRAFDDDGRLIDFLCGNPYDVGGRTQIIQSIMSLSGPKGVYQMTPDMPFCMAIRKEHLMNVGGFDEDFIGCASEDCDLLDRLMRIGCHYHYAEKGIDVIHLYHGRRTIKQLEEDPGFAYNINLRNERKRQLVRNVGRKWGELIDFNAPQESAPVHLVLWVTSKCDLNCPLCDQKTVRKSLVGYEMSTDELLGIIASCKQRGLHFSTIEITGGEPSMWSIFESGIKLLSRSGIADKITFITNGNDAERVALTANKYGIRYTVSANQATRAQIATHKRLGVGVQFNTSGHLPVPESPIPDSLPARCSQSHDRDGRVVKQLEYIKGRVYYCCMALANSSIVGMAPELSCDFEEDFVSYFSNRNFDVPVCSVCLCNEKVWNFLCL
jgi:glycosyltransferase involved in cell wall biosynthesis